MAHIIWETNNQANEMINWPLIQYVTYDMLIISKQKIYQEMIENFEKKIFNSDIM